MCLGEWGGGRFQKTEFLPSTPGMETQAQKKGGENCI